MHAKDQVSRIFNPIHEDTAAFQSVTRVSRPSYLKVPENCVPVPLGPYLSSYNFFISFLLLLIDPLHLIAENSFKEPKSVRSKKWFQIFTWVTSKQQETSANTRQLERTEAILAKCNTMSRFPRRSNLQSWKCRLANKSIQNWSSATGLLQHLLYCVHQWAQGFAKPSAHFNETCNSRPKPTKNRLPDSGYCRYQAFCFFGSSSRGEGTLSITGWLLPGFK